MNLDEIKKRANKLKADCSSDEVEKRPFDFQSNASWAADTILQLVADIDKININMKDLSAGYQQAIKVAVEREHQINKLTAANKIMREQLNHTWPNVGFEIVNQHNEQAIAEADEVMK